MNVSTIPAAVLNQTRLLETGLRIFYAKMGVQYEKMSDDELKEFAVQLMQETLGGVAKIYKYHVEHYYRAYVPVAILAMLAVVFNAYLVVASRWVKRKTVTIKIGLCLTVCDVVSLIVHQCKTWAEFYVRYSDERLSNCWAFVAEMLYTSSFTTGMLLQIVLAVNHLILIVWPLRHRRLMAGKNVKTALILSWLSPPFVQMIKATALAPDDQGLFKNCQHAYTNQKLFKDTWTLFLFGFISTIVVIYSHIIEVVRKRKQAWRSMSQDGELQRNQKSQLDSEMRTIYTTITILCTFIFSWMMWDLVMTYMEPLAGMFLNMPYYFHFWFRWTKDVMFVTKPIVNIIVYLMRTVEFQKALTAMHGAGKRKLCGANGIV